ncbi:MAG: PIN domain-containing protein [Planctomycetota bacterium]
MKRLRMYVDTSVFGGCYDPGFAQESNALLAMMRRGEIILLTSDLLASELLDAPTAVKAIFDALPEEGIERLWMGPESEFLRDRYMEANVVGPSAMDDAHHVALATVGRADMIVSWNFKHLVHFEKIRGFNAVNLREGYPTIEVHSPKEVV